MKFISIIALAFLLGCNSPQPEPVEKIQLQAKKPSKPVERPAVEIKVPSPSDYYLSRYESKFDSSEDGTKINIELASKLINGVVLLPGAVFSFNKVVGNRTKERGFVDSRVIMSGVTQIGIGGGVCQVSSTLNGAVIFAGLKPNKWRVHSTGPMKYIKPGLDAAVAWPNIDYAFTNTHPFPIMIKSGVDGGDLFVSIFGQSTLKNKTIKLTSWSKNGDRFKVRKQTLPWYKGSYNKKIQDGKNGKYVWVKIESSISGEMTEFTHLANYRPAHEVWNLGPEHPESDNYKGDRL